MLSMIGPTERCPVTSTAKLLQRAHEALRLHISGEHEAARTSLIALWEELGDQGNPMVRCSVAHYLADLQGSVESSLHWNLLAWQEVGRVAAPDQVETELGVSSRQLYPSLLLNLAEDYRKLGQSSLARDALDRARTELARLTPDQRPAGLDQALDALADRINVEGGAANGAPG